MKNAQINNNPTAYFLHQATNLNPEYREKINKFVEKLLNLKSCVLCKVDYNFTDRIPRILIHCGHTFCSACLKNFHKNRRVRCPMCLKLIKNIDTLDRLPVNHTIFSKMAEEHKEDYKREFMAEPAIEKSNENPKKSYANDIEFSNEFIQAEKKLMLGLGKNDPNILEKDYVNHQTEYVENDLEYCSVHIDRVKHFYCLTHKTCFCRACKEMFHSKSNCGVVDLYDSEANPELLLNGDIQDPNEKAFFEGLDEDNYQNEDEILGDDDLDLDAKKSTNSYQQIYRHKFDNN